MSEPVKQINYGEGVRKYSMNMEEYDAVFSDGFTAGVATTNDSGIAEKLEAARREIKDLNKNKSKEIKAAWTDGYQCAEEDAFHGSQTTFRKSDTYKEYKDGK